MVMAGADGPAGGTAFPPVAGDGVIHAADAGARVVNIFGESAHREVHTTWHP
jgi:hypothetical protein